MLIFDMETKMKKRVSETMPCNCSLHSSKREVRISELRVGIITVSGKLRHQLLILLCLIKFAPKKSSLKNKGGRNRILKLIFFKVPANWVLQLHVLAAIRSDR